jgi:hypothetical protein
MKIKFTPWKDPNEMPLLRPKPATAKLPEWYKSKKPLMDGDKKHRLFPDGNQNVTVKWCNPFGDALMTGYFALLETDVQVSIIRGKSLYRQPSQGASFPGHDTAGLQRTALEIY